jgi:hypothetical protein
MLFVPRATKERKERFIHAMQMAEDILRINPSGISTLVRLLAASLQAKSLNSVCHSGGLRILSSYPLDDMHKIWIITEADRASTTILLSEEY